MMGITGWAEKAAIQTPAELAKVREMLRMILNAVSRAIPPKRMC
jgi:hypothetical protein